MDVNSGFKRFFNHRLMAGSVMLWISFIAPSFAKPPDRDLRAKQVNVIIRQIGHQLLLQAGDSTSRVLPITETKEGTFLLQFENEFVFSHDSLMSLSLGFLSETQFPSGYTVTVHDCITAGIVYGFQVNNTLPDILPCRGRREPLGCYTIEFAFADFYENAEPGKADVQRIEERKPTEEHESVEVKHESIEVNKEVKPKHKEFKPPASDYGIDPPTEEIKPVNVDQSASPKLEEFKTTTFDYPLANLFYCGLVVLGVTLLISRFGKTLRPAAVQNTPVMVQNQNRPIIKESVQEFVGLGKFLFDGKGQRLLLGSEVISLTDKECKILELLNKNFGELILRETLMQKVWINEGVITGRSLDMFVSKLRKKLSSDPDLRITNVHGRGYKLEISWADITTR